MFKASTDASIDLELALQYFNKGIKRVSVLDNGYWYLEDFFVFQYSPTPSLKNRVHKSALEMYWRTGIDLFSVRGLMAIKPDKKTTISIEQYSESFSRTSAELPPKDKDQEQIKDNVSKSNSKVVDSRNEEVQELANGAFTLTNLGDNESPHNDDLYQNITLQDMHTATEVARDQGRIIGEQWKRELKGRNGNL